MKFVSWPRSPTIALHVRPRGTLCAMVVLLVACEASRAGPAPEVATGVASASASGASLLGTAVALDSLTPGWFGARVELDPGREGALRVAHVYGSSPAGRAGIASGDTVLLVDGEPAVEVRERLERPTGGTTLALRVLRDGAERSVELSAEPRPTGVELAQRELLGKPAPELTSLATVRDEAPTLGSLAGRVVLLDFWASFCGPCREASAELGRLARTLGPQGLSVVGVARDEEVASARDAAASWAMAYPSGVDTSGALAETYVVSTLPTLFVIDRKGVIRGMLVGYGTSSLAAVERHVEKLIAESP